MQLGPLPAPGRGALYRDLGSAPAPKVDTHWSVCYLYIVSQLNINQTPEFEEDLSRLMRVRKIATKSEAVRMAVRESLERSLQSACPVDYRSWIGLAAGEGENLQPRFRSDDDLWN